MSNDIRAVSTAASRIGMTTAEYIGRVASGEKWCTGCKAWHPVGAFSRDRTRGDGRNAKCLIASRGRPPFHRYPQREQARRAVAGAIRKGKLVKPGVLPCTDCAHTGTDRRHEYDHFLGYEPEHHLDVEPVCTTCHAERERLRRLSPDAARWRPA